MQRVFELTTRIQSISRSEGRTATAAIAYRACCAIDCEREARTHDYSRKRGLETSGMVLPASAPAWGRSALWNAAETVERNGKRGKRAGAWKANAVTAREFMFSFPAELSQAGRLAAAETIARHLVDTHGIAADFAIHRPGKEGDERNFHCHMLTTTRRLTEKGLGEKAREWTDLKSGARLAKQFRAFVATVMTAQLAAEGKADLVRVEHLSFAERGGGRATKHQGPSKTNALRNAQGRARAAWLRTEHVAMAERHVKELAGLKTRQDFALAAKLGDLAERGRRGEPADKLQAEKTAYLARQHTERSAMLERHRQDEAQFGRAVDAKRQYDRVVEVQGRKIGGHGIERGGWKR